jgi:hypothetical protein
MLLFRKTALLGAAVMLPVMANIVMVNLFFAIAWAHCAPRHSFSLQCWPSFGTTVMHLWAYFGPSKLVNRLVCGDTTA